MSYLGQPVENDIQINRYEYIVGTPTDLYDGSVNTFPCVYAGNVEVSLMGIELAKSDFTATSGVDIVLASDAPIGAIVQIKGFYKVLDNNAETQTFDPTGTPLVSTTTHNAIIEAARNTSTRNTVISASASGVLALATTPTPSFATVTYTGNGTSQDITTGLKSYDPNWVSGRAYLLANEQDAYCIHNYYIYKLLADVTSATTPDADPTHWEVVADGDSVSFPNSMVWIKSRSDIASNHFCSTLMGKTNRLQTDTTAAEASGVNAVQDFLVGGFNVTTGTAVNNSGSTYVAWQETFDTMVSGTTNQGKRYITASNAQSGKGMTIYVGSGTAGHEIPHGLGTNLNVVYSKNRDATTSWPVSKIDSDEYGLLDLNNAFVSPNAYVTNGTDNVFTVGGGNSINQLNANHVAYFSSNRDNHTVTKMYQGTGVAGNVVPLGLDMTQAGAKVMIKKLSGAGSWVLEDNVRGGGKVLYADLSDAEATATTIEFTSTGIIINATTSTYNEAGSTYLIEATVPNYDKPNGGLDIPAGSVISYAEGTDGTTGDKDAIETTTLHSNLTMTAGAKNYIYLDKGNVASTSIYPLLKQLDSTLDANSPIYNVGEGEVYDTAGTQKSRVILGEVIADGEGLVIPDTLVEYPVAHQDITSMEVHGNAKFHGDIEGKQICTAWVNFDGTTTPPTIRDSYNVSDVVRTATGRFEIYPNDDIDIKSAFPIVTIGGVGVENSAQISNISLANVNDNFYTMLNVNGANTLANHTNITVTIIGGKA